MPIYDVGPQDGSGGYTPGGAPLEPPPSYYGPLTDVRISVVRLDTRAPIAGAIVKVWAVAPSGAESLAAEGASDAAGEYVFQASTEVDPPPGSYRFAVSAPAGSGGLSVPFGAVESPLLGICPPATDALVCEVGEKQLLAAEEFAQLNEQWNGPNGFTVDMTHAYLENKLLPRDPRLKDTWLGDTSWGLLDFAILPDQWPAVLEGRAAMAKVLAEPPWPDIGGKDWFYRCARALPIARGKAGEPLSPISFRLFSPALDSYWPRWAIQMRRDLASRWLLGLPAIFGCLTHKIEQKASEVTRSAKAWGLIGSAAAILLAPLTGGAAVTSLFTEAGAIVGANYDLPVPGADVGSGMAASGLILGGQTAQGQGLLTSSLTNILSALLPGDVNPELAALLKAGVPKLVDVALDVFSVGSPAGNAIAQGAPSFGSLTSIASAAVGQAVSMLVGAIKGMGVRRVQDFYSVVMDLENLPGKLSVWLMWCMQTLGLDQFLRDVLKGLFGIDVDVLDAMRGRAREDGVAIPRSLESSGTRTARQAVTAVAGIGLGSGALLLPLLLAE